MAYVLWVVLSLGALCSTSVTGKSIISVDQAEHCSTGTNEPGICVYQYHCYDGIIANGGDHILDVRQSLDDCADYMMVCCKERKEPTTNSSRNEDPEVDATTTSTIEQNGTVGEQKKPPVLMGDIPPYLGEDCGKRHPEGVAFKLENNVHSESEYGEYPWAAAIFTRRPDGSLKYICGGALIDSAAVLTTASCLSRYQHNVRSVVVRLGEWDMSTEYEPIPHVDVDVQKIHIHPQYGKTSKINDIAIVILDDTVELGHTIGVVCLPPADYAEQTGDVHGVGWGDVPQFVRSNKLPQTILKKTHLQRITHEECQRTLRNLMDRPYRLDPSFLCAKASSFTEMLPCKGDSGSPYATEIEHGSNRMYLVGLSSWGYDCNQQRHPTVLTNVAYNREWIDRVIKSEDLSIWSYTYERIIESNDEQ